MSLFNCFGKNFSLKNSKLSSTILESIQATPVFVDTYLGGKEANISDI